MSNQDKPAFPKQASEFSGESFGMSLREYAAIKLRVPDSGTDWLDAMIEKSLLNEFAGKAMQAHCSGLAAADISDWHDEVTRLAYLTANAMLKASKGE